MRQWTRFDTVLFVMAVMPYILALIFIQGDSAPVADHAVLEMYVRETKNGLITFGPYSRFGWHHPGPALFYVLAPVYWLFGAKSQIGLMVGAALINIASVFLIIRTILVEKIPMETRRWTAIVLIAIAAYVNVQTLADPWNPYITLMPFVLFLVLAACVGAGSIGSILPAAVVASFVVQAHIGYAPIIAIVFVSAAFCAYVFGIRVNNPCIRRSSRFNQWLFAVSLIICWIPVVIGELRDGQNGNLHRIIHFVGANAPSKQLVQSVSIVAQQWGKVVLYNLGVGDTDFPFQIHNIIEPNGSSIYTYGFLVILIGLSTTIIVAYRRREAFIVALSVNSLIGVICAVISVSHMVGNIAIYLVIWIAIMGAVGCVPILWLLTECIKQVRYSPLLKYIACMVFISGIIVHADWDKRIVNERGPIVEEVVSRIRTSDIGNPLIVSISSLELWPIAAGTMLQLDKAGFRTRVENDWCFMFGPWKTPHGDEIDRIEFRSPGDSRSEDSADSGDYLYSSDYLVVKKNRMSTNDVKYGYGWGHPEEWGRFAIERVAVVSVPVASIGDTILVEVTAFPEMNQPQIVTVKLDNAPPCRFEIGGNSWKWRQIRLPVEAIVGGGSERRYAQLRFEFARSWIVGGADTRTLSLPFRRIYALSTATISGS